VQSAFLAPDVVKAKDWLSFRSAGRSIDPPEKSENFINVSKAATRLENFSDFSVPAWSLYRASPLRRAD